jgi:hypothetical protein
LSNALQIAVLLAREPTGVPRSPQDITDLRAAVERAALAVRRLHSAT